jgi:hypothetical protein
VRCVGVPRRLGRRRKGVTARHDAPISHLLAHTPEEASSSSPPSPFFSAAPEIGNPLTFVRGTKATARWRLGARDPPWRPPEPQISERNRTAEVRGPASDARNFLRGEEIKFRTRTARLRVKPVSLVGQAQLRLLLLLLLSVGFEQVRGQSSTKWAEVERADPGAARRVKEARARVGGNQSSHGLAALDLASRRRQAVLRGAARPRRR